jgi:hypothetical protein
MRRRRERSGFIERANFIASPSRQLRQIRQYFFIKLFLHVIWFYSLEHPVSNFYDDAFAAIIEAEMPLQHNAIREPEFFDQGLQLRQDLINADAMASGTHAQEHRLLFIRLHDLLLVDLRDWRYKRCS